MNPPTDTRFTLSIVTVQMQPSSLTEADLKSSPSAFAKLTKANERAGLGKLYMHKAEMMVHHRDGTAQQGRFQSELFDTDDSDGKKELTEMVVALAQSVVDRAYPSSIIS